MALVRRVAVVVFVLLLSIELMKLDFELIVLKLLDWCISWKSSVCAETTSFLLPLPIPRRACAWSRRA